MDDADKATVIEETNRDDAVAAIRRKAASRLPAGFDGNCLECGEAIPPARLECGYARCTDCVQAIEEENRRLLR